MKKNILTGIILSGGKSLRMGTDKGLIQFNEKPLIEYSISVLSELCEEIIICANKSGYEYLGYKIVPDIYPDCGPMGGLYSGLLTTKSEYNLVVPCDVPFITKELYIQLLEYINNGTMAVIPSIKNEIQPLCGIYSIRCIPLLKSLLLQNKYKMLRAVQEMDAHIVPIKNNSEIFSNINTQGELLKLSHKHAG